MTTSFYNGITGLKSFQKGLDIWGDNISNINTIGYKESTPDFDTLFAKTLTGSISDDIGIGSTVTSSSLNLQEGSIINTDNTFDLALSDRGWFKVTYRGQEYFTRNGSFSKDANGELVNSDGAYLQVFKANNIYEKDGKYYVDTEVPTDNLRVGKTDKFFLPTSLTIPAVPTTKTTLQANLTEDIPLLSKIDALNTADMSAVYDTSGRPIGLIEGDNFVFAAGDETQYIDNTLQREICFDDDKKDNKDSMLDFSVNGVKIQLPIKDGSNKEEILENLAKYLQSTNQTPTIKEQLKQAGVTYEITDEGILFKSTSKLNIISNNPETVKSSAAEILTYSHNPQNDLQFKTVDDLKNRFSDVLSAVYGDGVEVDYANGKYYFVNNTTKNINTYIYKTKDSNEALIKNFGNLANTITPHKSAQSGEFYQNQQSFGGYMYDKDGNKIDITYRFTKQEVNTNQTTWIGEVLLNGEVATKDTFLFDSQGHLISPTVIKLDNPPVTMNMDVTNYTSVDVGTKFTQDGAPEGNLTKYDVLEDGRIVASFTNAVSVTLAQIPIYHFQNEQGLDTIGSNLFTPTSNSNDPILYDKEHTKILSHALESSNVSFSQAMTELIVTQKAFSASAKTVTTSDQMIQKAIDMKR